MSLLCVPWWLGAGFLVLQRWHVHCPLKSEHACRELCSQMEAVYKVCETTALCPPLVWFSVPPSLFCPRILTLQQSIVDRTDLLYIVSTCFIVVPVLHHQFTDWLEPGFAEKLIVGLLWGGRVRVRVVLVIFGEEVIKILPGTSFELN